jgi:S-adenosylmethionine hydrolase
MKRKRPLTGIARRKGNKPIALLTDFGNADHYVGTMKGVILSINPRATIVDISHEVAPYDVREAGYLLWASYCHFPSRTIFLSVVDPGVGGSRSIICIQAGSRIFIAPDNGLLDFIVLQEDIRQGYDVLQSGRSVATEISSTFHGRDIFAPLVANLSLGGPIRKFGRLVDLSRPSSPFFDAETGKKTARILHIDRFGNLVTNIPERYFSNCNVGVGSTRISKHIGSFSEAPEGEACLIVGSSKLIEIVAKESNAAVILGAKLKTPLTVLPSDRGW